MTFVVFLLVLSILVLVHEAGHFTAAKLFGIRVEEFAFGLPFTKPIFKFKRGETQYSLYPILFGGFVRVHGEESEGSETKRSFWNRSKGQRLAVLGAGIFMNVVLAIAAFIVLYSVVGVPVSQRETVTVVEVAKDSPAEAAGIKAYDRIIEVEGKPLVDVEEFGQLMKSWAGTGVNITVERGETTTLFEGLMTQSSEQVKTQFIPRENPPEGEGAAGVVIATYPYIQTTNCSMWAPSCAISAIKQGFSSTGIWLYRVADGLAQIGRSLTAGQVPEGVSGPVGIYQLTGIVASEGWLPMLELIAILSINLGVFNLLPIPALDGGRIFFVLVEILTRKRVSPALEQKVNTWGMIFLISLMIVISFQDVIRLGVLNRLLGKE